MNTDRELLELAAKAAGLPECGWMGPAFMYVKDNTFTDWSPLTDDGDALRLAVKLGMNVEVNLDDECTRILDEFSRVMLRQMHVDGDAGAATRRAIVRAAAAIGENMK